MPYAKLKFRWMILNIKFQFLGINRVVKNWYTYMIREYVESTFINNILNIPTGTGWALEGLKGKLLRFCEQLKMPTIHSYLVTGDAKCRLFKSLMRIPSLIEYTFVKWYLLKLLTCRPPFSSYSTKSRQFTFKPRFSPPHLHTITLLVCSGWGIPYSYTKIVITQFIPAEGFTGFRWLDYRQVFTGIYKRLMVENVHSTQYNVSNSLLHGIAAESEIGWKKNIDMFPTVLEW